MTQETYSADDLTAKPAKTSITGISNKTAGKLVITWKKAKSADGYEIYRRAGTTNPYVRAAVIKSGSTTKYTNAKLKKDIHIITESVHTDMMRMEERYTAAGQQ